MRLCTHGGGDRAVKTLTGWQQFSEDFSMTRAYSIRFVFTDSTEVETVKSDSYATVLALVAGHKARGKAFTYTLKLDGVTVEDTESNDTDTDTLAGLASMILDTHAARHTANRAEQSAREAEQYATAVATGNREAFL